MTKELLLFLSCILHKNCTDKYKRQIKNSKTDSDDIQKVLIFTKTNSKNDNFNEKKEISQKEWIIKLILLILRNG